VQLIVPVLIARGRYPHPWVGFLGYSITPTLVRRLSLPVESGILVARLYQDSPADRAGLRGADREVAVGNTVLLAGGDIITGVDGKPIKDREGFDAYLQDSTKVGDEITLDILRDGKPLTLRVKLVEEPSTE